METQTRWGPYTPMKSIIANGPLVIDRAEGVYVWDESGHRYLDAHAGLWLANVGYGRHEILDAMDRQARRLAWFSSFGGFANRPSLDLADRLVGLFRPDGMAHVFFSGSGSEANETALKISRQYWKLNGRPQKIKLIGREHAYHGVTLGALSVAGITPNRQAFEPLLADTRHVAAPYKVRCAFHPDSPICTRACVREVERVIRFEGPDTVAAFIAEPIQAAGGVIIPPPDYLAEIRDICRQYDVLFIADEVVTGFGRLGQWSGSRHYGIQPDIMSFAKGVTSGYFPLGVTAVSEAVMQVFLGASGDGPEFRHGNTYSGHPIGCAAALANLDIMERDHLPEHAANMGRSFKAGLDGLQERYPAVIKEADSVGLLGRIELEDPKGLAKPGDLGKRVAAEMLKADIILRPVNDIITISPPLIITESELTTIMEAFDTVLGSL